MTSGDGRMWSWPDFRIDDQRVTRGDTFDDAGGLAECGNAQRLGDDRDVALAAAILDDEAPAACCGRSR